MGTAADSRTLAIDIGGSGLKIMILDPEGQPLTDRIRKPTPEEPLPGAVIDILHGMAKDVGEFDRISVGFPGVVVEGEVRSAVNLHEDWVGVNIAQELEERTGKPTRAANDADIQGLGVIEGQGVELVLTLGTGMGSGLFVGGHLVPNLELGHHPFRKSKTYEDVLGAAALKKHGEDKWNKRLNDAIRVLDHIFNYRMLYLGGGNAKKIDFQLPGNVQRVPNVAGLLGGIALWQQ